ncbi:MAG: hypothetical protein EON59_10375 [Alphaproteobacteria bacterium]|nr:MAG: hypothetical protein EON59_10375 [Alphaproteobacteria bacterium]
MATTSPLMPEHLVDCIATGREPTVHELFAVAERIWIDGAAERSAFAWDRLAADADERLIALRGAQIALTGGS